LIIYNPNAGRFPSGVLVDRAALVFGERGWEIEVAQASSGEHVTRLARQAGAAQLDGLFVVGGDGSINLAARGLMGSGTALGVLPAGTANVWAQELGLPGLNWTRLMALEESARRLAVAQPHPVDIGLINEVPFLLWAGIGLDGFIVNRIEPRGRWEKVFSMLHYGAASLWEAGSWHGMNLQVEVDGYPIEGHFLLAVASNIHLYAGGLVNISPNALIDDGEMDLWLCKGDALIDAARAAWDLLYGRHVSSQQVQYLPFRELSIRSVSPAFFQVDGEPLHLDGEIKIQVKPKALRVFIPEKTPRQLFLTLNG
jgi:YegS/Rv2252/BmrU family lipid kinase